MPQYGLQHSRLFVLSEVFRNNHFNWLIQLITFAKRLVGNPLQASHHWPKYNNQKCLDDTIIAKASKKLAFKARKENFQLN